jgi:SAM-dependent methyltransferase
VALRLCRSCGAPLTATFVDLGMSPLANAFIHPEQERAPEAFYPLHVHVCNHCFLVQVEELASPEKIFTNYIYFSSYSETWLDHCARYVESIVPRLGLTEGARVVEIASNDGALLGMFKRYNLHVLGVEPAVNVAQIALDQGIPTDISFFGRGTAFRLRRECAADLIIANNVLAHVPNLNDFISGLKLLLAPTGTITIEFPHLARLIAERQFDTIYHEHFSYFSLLAAETALRRHGLAVFDVESIPTHGGSLRLYVSHVEDARGSRKGLTAIRAAERAAGLDGIAAYQGFAEAAAAAKCDLLEFLIDTRRAGKRVVGYGAAAKGNTLLNYCGAGREFLDYVVDRNPHKQGLLLPGTRLPVYDPARVFETKPDYLIILPWNLKDEISRTMAGIGAWGGRFVVPLPRPQIVDAPPGSRSSTGATA